jgi:hypothetical protein
VAWTAAGREGLAVQRPLERVLPRADVDRLPAHALALAPEPAKA